MPDPTIRPTTLADIPAVTAIYAEAVHHGTATFELEAPDVAEMTRRFNALCEGSFPYLVADLDGRIAGYAYVAPHRPRPAYRYTVENSIYLDPAFHRRGIGSALLDELITQSTACDFRQMVAVIGDSANAASIALHARAGFAMIGTTPNVGYKFGRWLDCVLMQRALGDGSKTAPQERRQS